MGVETFELKGQRSKRPAYSPGRKAWQTAKHQAHFNNLINYIKIVEKLNRCDTFFVCVPSRKFQKYGIIGHFILHCNFFFGPQSTLLEISSMVGNMWIIIIYIYIYIYIYNL